MRPDDSQAAQAQAFWAQMATFSRRVFNMLGLPEAGSPHGQVAWGVTATKARAPTGAALHWTAADTLVSTLKWFCDPASKVSAHMVIADRRLLWAEACLDGLPLIAALPATAVQCRAPTQTAWHVRDMDASLYGIENQNVGRLQGRDNTLTWTTGNRLVPYRSDKQPLSLFGSRYEPYTQAQVQTNVIVLRALHALHGQSLQTHRLLGHSCWQSERTNAPPEDKLDPGPQYPIEAVRKAVFAADGQLPHDVIGAEYALRWRAALAKAAMYAYRKAQGRYTQAALDDILQTGDSKAWTAFVITVARPADVQAYPVLADAMAACLGFECGPSVSKDLQQASMKLCQRLLGLVQDGIVGPKTSQALALRFRHIFLGS